MDTKSNKEPLRIAAFGFRSIPPHDGCGGADKFAIELYSRLVEKGHSVVGYNRVYQDAERKTTEYKGITLVSLKTTPRDGIDTLIHSFKATIHIIRNNTGDVIHIHNGGNSIWSIPLRLSGKKVLISQDGIDWKRDKWPWYGKLFLFMSALITVYFSNRVIFDNIFVKELFEKKFSKKFDFIPYGSEIKEYERSTEILNRLGLEPGE